MDFTGASGAIPRRDRDRMDTHAELYYEEIRKRSSDIEAIVKNTQFSVEEITLVKNHLFFNKYTLNENVPTTFDPDYDISLSWQRLIEGNNIQEMDIILIKHELLEYKFMTEQNLSYLVAHEKAEEYFNYSKYVRELDLNEGIIVI